MVDSPWPSGFDAGCARKAGAWECNDTASGERDKSEVTETEIIGARRRSRAIYCHRMGPYSRVKVLPARLFPALVGTAASQGVIGWSHALDL